MSSLSQILAADAASDAAPIRRRHPRENVPTWPYGVLTSLSKLTPVPADILDACTTLVGLRHWLNWIEYRQLHRAVNARYLIPTSQHKLAGDLIGISNPGLTLRRARLARTVKERRQVKNSPSLPRIHIDTAAEATQLLLEHRAGLVPGLPPPDEDLIGAAAYAAIWPDTPDLDQLAADIRAAITIIVALRRHFDDLEADILDLGRALNMSNTELGRPFGRLGIRATWKARNRPRNGDRAGRRRRVQAPEVDEPVIITSATTLDTDLSDELDIMIHNLLKFRPRIDNEDLDVWLSWLAEHAAEPLTDRSMSLLWAAADEIADHSYAKQIDGLVPLAEKIRDYTRQRRR